MGRMAKNVIIHGAADFDQLKSGFEDFKKKDYANSGMHLGKGLDGLTK